MPRKQTTKISTLAETPKQLCDTPCNIVKVFKHMTSKKLTTK